MASNKNPKPGTEGPLPSEVALALATNRPEMINGLRTRVAGGDALPIVVQVALLGLVENMIRDRESDRAAHERVQVALRDATLNAQGLMHKLEALLHGGKPADYADEGEA